MKITLQYSLLVLGLCLFTACDKGFDDLNENKVSPTGINPVFVLNNAVLNGTSDFNSLVYEIGIVQHMVSPNSGVLTGANFNQDNRLATLGVWQRYYRQVVRSTADVISQVENDPTRINLFSMARIWQSYAFMVLTDTYGDVPYTEAGQGFIKQIQFPKYDPQEAIYNGVIKELSEATAALDAAKPIETADILYGGNVAQWKKLGNSLLLRAGMRLAKANATLAQQTVLKAFQAGVIEANADNAVVRHDNNYQNPTGQTLNGTEANNFYLTEPFVDYLKRTNDPRLKSIAVRYVGAKSGPEQTAARASTDPTLQIGMPLGKDNTSVAAAAAALKLASFYEFTQLDRTRMGKLTAPFFHLTAAQTQLLLAEAAQRGWITGAAADFYNKGVRLNMEQLAAYSADAAVPAAAIDAYLTANPFAADKALELINTQYWIAAFLNGPESFANFRRSGFPVLAPNPFPGKDIKGNFINRLTYPNSELSVNTTNVNEAIGRMGADNLDTKVWWHK